jgi:hypothetical protein
MPRLVKPIILCMCLTLPAVIEAQTCQGAASFSSGPARVGAGFNVSDNVKSYGAQLAVGAGSGPYASADLSRAEYDNVANAGVGVGVTGGYAIDLAPAHAAQFCPLVSFGYQTGPDIDTGIGTISTSAHAVGFGGSFGGAIAVAPSFDFVPFVAAQYWIEQASASGAGTTASSSANYTSISVGAGFVVNKMLTLQPAVSIPVGLTGGKTTFELAFAFNFGGSSTQR